jgi:UDP-perosamine 4-acetyltransferase
MRSDASRIVGLGAGGHAKILIELLASEGRYALVGLTEFDRTRWGGTLMGYPILGGDGELPRLRSEGVDAAFIGVGAVSSAGTRVRERLFREAAALGFELPSLVHDRAIVSPSARLAPGSVVMGGAVVNAAADVGVNVTIYSGALVEHDCVIGAHAHVSPGAQLAGAVRLGEGAFVGIGASIIQGIRVGAWATIGAGAAVISDVPDGAVAVGIPARILKGARGS